MGHLTQERVPRIGYVPSSTFHYNTLRKIFYQEPYKNFVKFP